MNQDGGTGHEEERGPDQARPVCRRTKTHDDGARDGGSRRAPPGCNRSAAAPDMRIIATEMAELSGFDHCQPTVSWAHRAYAQGEETRRGRYPSEARAGPGPGQAGSMAWPVSPVGMSRASPRR